MSIASTPVSRIIAAARTINPALYPRAASAGQATAKKLLVEKVAVLSVEQRMATAVQSSVGGSGDQITALAIIAIRAGASSLAPQQRAILAVQIQARINEIAFAVQRDRVLAADRNLQSFLAYIRG